MLTSFALIFVLGLTLGHIFTQLKLPSLLGMLFTGMILSPYALNLLDPTILSISADLRQLALVIILTRAGLSLNLEDLKSMGRPAVLMCFVPACFEMAAITLFAPLVLDVTTLEAALIGSVLAAVSPAVVVPRMIKISQEGYGSERRVPKLVLAGAAVDDVFVIVVFTALSSLVGGNAVSATALLEVPISIVTGIAMGALVGLVLVAFFRKFTSRDGIKVVILLSVSFLLIAFGNWVGQFVPMSGLLAIMAAGITLCQLSEDVAGRLSGKYNELWIGAELLLFALVGATVDLEYALAAGLMAILVVLAGLVFRMVGVFLCMLGTNLNKKERLFCMLAYTPKATVQAAIGALPLAMGLECGPIVLTTAVLSILITAPFGAVCIDKTYQKLLTRSV